jgi:transcriptional regulator with XRE-family HTH domain
VIDPKVFKAVRKRLGLSQQELADALGLSRVTINKMERGRLKNGIPDEIGARLMALGKRSDARPVEHAGIVERHVSAVLTNARDCPRRPVDDEDLWDNEEDES